MQWNGLAYTEEGRPCKIEIRGRIGPLEAATAAGPWNDDREMEEYKETQHHQWWVNSEYISFKSLSFSIRLQ